MSDVRLENDCECAWMKGNTVDCLFVCSVVTDSAKTGSFGE